MSWIERSTQVTLINVFTRDFSVICVKTSLMKKCEFEPKLKFKNNHCDYRVVLPRNCRTLVSGAVCPSFARRFFVAGNCTAEFCPFSAEFLLTANCTAIWATRDFVVHRCNSKTSNVLAFLPQLEKGEMEKKKFVRKPCTNASFPFSYNERFHISGNVQRKCIKFENS